MSTDVDYYPLQAVVARGRHVVPLDGAAWLVSAGAAAWDRWVPLMQQASSEVVLTGTRQQLGLDGVDLGWLNRCRADRELTVRVARQPLLEWLSTYFTDGTFAGAVRRGLMDGHPLPQPIVNGPAWVDVRDPQRSGDPVRLGLWTRGKQVWVQAQVAEHVDSDDVAAFALELGDAGVVMLGELPAAGMSLAQRMQTVRDALA